MKVYGFEITGSFDISNNLKPFLSAQGETVGFRLPNGKCVRPCIALEVESTDGTEYRYVTSEEKMSDMGFENLDYNDIRFIT